MVTRAIARYIRIAPRKTRKVIDLVRGLPVLKAEAILNSVNRRPSAYIKRLLGSALDSASKRFHLSPADLYISLIKADQGPMLKRYRAASMGRATAIKHRTTHITLELDKVVEPERKTVKMSSYAKVSEGRQGIKEVKAKDKKEKTRQSKKET
jgi:large subunit ribosomal protein L22